MKLEYKITKYFEENNLFDDSTADGLTIKNDSNTLLIKGKSRDLIELADILVSLVTEKGESHIHIDDLTLLKSESDFSEIIIEKQ